MNSIKLPIKEFTFQFSRSSGAGGQNINKVNTKATLLWNVTESKAFSEAVIDRFLHKFSRRILADGFISISSQRFRSQASNIADCIEKLQFMLSDVMDAPVIRKKTKPTRSSVERRINEKKSTSSLKKSRQSKRSYDE